MSRQLVAGVDSSTQQTKLVIVEAETGKFVHSASRPHPEGTELDPEHWWSALRDTSTIHSSITSAVSIAAQQHTTIFLNDTGESVRDAILWNDTRAAESADQLRHELSDKVWLHGPGLLPDASHPISKLRWLAEHEPDNAARVHTALLPHDWLTWRFLERSGAATTDRSDASATGYWSPQTNTYLPEFVRHALGHDLLPPVVRSVDAVVGTSHSGLLVAAGCGDNAATHLGLNTQIGDVIVSIGTSTTISMRTTTPAKDTLGTIDTMADTRGGFIPIIVMLNGARILAATARMLGITLERLDLLAAEAEPGASGAILVPFLDGERNPRAAKASGVLAGLSRESMTPANISRASILGLACTIVDALETLTTMFGAPRRILLVGGGARSASLRQAVTDLAGQITEWPDHREHAAFGAARQAAWALTGTQPHWPELPATFHYPSVDLAWSQRVREQFRSSATLA